MMWDWNRYTAAPGNWPFPEYMLRILLPFALIDLVLRGLALWKSARNGQNVWFVFLLVVNSLGILPAIYLLLNKDLPPKTKKKK